MLNKHRNIEEPCEAKVSSTVLKTSRDGDILAEFNQFELFTEQTTERGSQFVATFDTGLKYLLTENIQLDAGVNIGLTQAADDIQPFMGVSVRF